MAFKKMNSQLEQQLNYYFNESIQSFTVRSEGKQ